VINHSLQTMATSTAFREWLWRLIHTERRGGQPAVRSRWLWRLDMLTRGANTA